MGRERDWVRAVMLPLIGYAAVIGGAIGAYFGYDDRAHCSPAKCREWTLSGAVVGALVCAAPVWAVTWVIWLVRQMGGGSRQRVNSPASGRTTPPVPQSSRRDP
ncbi:MAG: hypothetical protein JWO38_2797 [Gemmataceae bacterium]|nr:hypothetical protein [Gemmataceae bacterium]